MASQVIYECGNCTSPMKMLRLEVVNIEILQHVFVVNDLGYSWCNIGTSNYRDRLIFKIRNFSFD